MRIDIILDFNLEKQKIIERKQCYLELNGCWLTYKHEVLSERYNVESDSWYESYENLQERYLKRFIAGTSISWIEGSNAWRLDIEISGVDNLCIWFKKQNEAFKVQKSIEEWLLEMGNANG
jgi:hypothetical protein